MKFHLSFAFLLSIMTFQVIGQENKISNDRNKDHKLGQELFDHQLYGASRYTLARFAHQIHPATEDAFVNVQDDANGMRAIAGMRADYMSAENELLTFIHQKYPDPVTTPSILELGSYYYNQKWYKKCIDMYALVDLDDLPEYDMSEASFKKGYALFVSKEFNEAKKELSRTININNDFYYASNYYYGLCEYFMRNYPGAIASFERVKASPSYKSFVPYYITQIYFAHQQMDKVIAHGEQALKDPELRNRKEIRHILGQAYYNTKEFDKALPHLEYYEANTDKLTIEEFYQLGFTQYQLKKYNDAIYNFKELSQVNTKLGQMANYYLADCYHKNGDHVSARAAFKNVSQMEFDKAMQEEALFNYGKLSAESGYDREAINALLKIEKTSKYYVETQDIITSLLENTTDFAMAIQIIEAMPSINDKLKVTYQNLALKYGIQLYNNGQSNEAITQFTKAGQYQLSRITAAQSAYWLAQIYYKKGETATSQSYLDKYFKLADGITWMPKESSQASAYYLQGYNFLEKKDYTHAETSFKSAVQLFQQNSGKLKNEEITEKVWPDAIVRLGDCLFKKRDYKAAMTYYNQAIQKKQGSYVYALYQRGIIEGLMDEPFEKILTMMEVKTKHSQSEYADNALLQLGDTYFEVENTENAYQAYSDLVSKFPSSPLVNDALLKMALIAYNKGDMSTAIAHYKAVMKQNPTSKDSESALLGLQEIYINDLGKSDEYVSYINTLPGYKLNDLAADSLAYMVGALRYNEGEYEKAIIGFSNYLDKYPAGFNKINALYYRAESYAILKKYTLALDDYEKISKAGSSEFYIQSIKKAAIISYNHTQTFDKAYQYYDTYYKLLNDEDEQYKAALGALRSAFRIAKNDAVVAYGSIVESNKKATSDDKAVAAYYMGKTYYKENKLAEAKLAFEKASVTATNNQAAESRYLIAEILYKEGKKPEAEQQCNTANEANTAYPYWIAKSLMLMSDIYVERNDYFNARAALEAIIENFSDDKDLMSAAEDKLKKVEELEKQKTRIKTNSSNSLLEMQSGNGN